MEKTREVNNASVLVVQKAPSENRGDDADSNNAPKKFGSDGKTLLIPQPSDDPEDPLNWSWTTKHGVLFALAFSCLLSDWGLTYGATMFEIQAAQWKMSVVDVSRSISGGIFMQAPGGLLAVPLCQRFGRLPVLFWSQLLSCIVAIGSSQAKTYAGFTACRTLQGFFGAPPQVIGLTIIRDMFFFHERARKVNIWAFSFLLGPYMGPFVSGLCLEKLTWQQVMGILAAFYGASTLLIAALGRETLYNRYGENKISSGPVGFVSALTGAAGLRAKGRPTVWAVTKHQVSLLARPYLLIPTAGFVMVITMWTIGIVSTITQFMAPPPPPLATGYGFSHRNLALLFIAPMIGTVCAEIWGHWFNDFLQKRYIRTHGGVYKPENRLWGVYPAWIIGFCGLILFGQSIQVHLPWIGVAFGWGMNCFSTLGTTTAISAYVLDCFPHHAALAASWINFWRVIGGFTVTYFQLEWVAHNGPAVAFGVQAALVAAAIVAIIVTQIFGAGWRVKYPAPEQHDD